MNNLELEKCEVKQVKGDYEGPEFLSMYYNFLKGDYTDYADKMLSRCEALGISCTIVKINRDAVPGCLDRMEHIGSGQKKWNKMRRKYNKVIPFVIRTMLSELQRPVMYLHLDSMIQHCPPPGVFTDSVMISKGHGRGRDIRDSTYKILASPVYFSPSPIASEFLDDWIEKCLLDMTFAEHESLIGTYKQYGDIESVGCFDKVNLSSRQPEDDSYILF